MTRAALEALAKRCESEPASRELDVAIALAIFEPEDLIGHSPAKYTTSLDAAVSLVPSGWVWDLASTGTAWCMADAQSGELFASTKGKTPALALCAAALRARADLEAA